MANIELVRFLLKYNPEYTITKNMFIKSDISIKKLFYNKDNSILNEQIVYDVLYSKYISEEFIIWIIDIYKDNVKLYKELFLICCENGYYDACRLFDNLDDDIWRDGLNAACKEERYLIVYWILYKVGQHNIVDNDIMLLLSLNGNLKMIKYIDDTYGGSYDKKKLLKDYNQCSDSKNNSIIKWLKNSL